MGWILLLLVIGAAFYVVAVYNGLVTARNAFRNAFAQIDVQLTRRYDLIPNLVETARGYLRHERETLEAVIRARNAAVEGLRAAASDPGDATAVQRLAGACGEAKKLIGIAEQGASGRRELQPAAFAHEKLHLQILFQLADACGDVGLHAVQALGRMGDAAGFDNGAEDMQVGEFHILNF